MCIWLLEVRSADLQSIWLLVEHVSCKPFLNLDIYSKGTLYILHVFSVIFNEMLGDVKSIQNWWSGGSGGLNLRYMVQTEARTIQITSHWRYLFLEYKRGSKAAHSLAYQRAALLVQTRKIGSGYRLYFTTTVKLPRSDVQAYTTVINEIMSMTWRNKRYFQ